MSEQNVIIAGSGCAGHTAAIYAARADLAPLVFEGDEPGGQLSLTSEVENFPGFPDGVGGFELIERMKKQAQKFGATYQYGRIREVQKEGSHFVVHMEDGQVLKTRTLIVATGARARKLEVPGEAELFGQGVSSCATCDGAFYREREVVVVGGGDSAMEEALFLTRFANKVTVIHRRDALRASKIMQDRALKHPKIAFLWNSWVSEVKGTPEEGVTGVMVSSKDKPPELFKTDGLFLGIGHVPNSDFVKDLVDRDEDGYIRTVPGHTPTEIVKTRTPGLFACGDVVDRRFRQAISAAGMGCMAAMEAEEFLASHAPASVGT
ncbi:MAG: thioredoxin reductase [Candidatus Xenobia bacterium]